MNRRQMLTGLGGAAFASGPALAVEKPGWMSSQLPDGTREAATLEALPGKQKLIRLTDRPPNYESPIETFRTPVTPNDQFFVRYHLAGIPPMADLGKWSLTVGGEAADRQVTLNLDDLRGLPQVEVAAVCQCSGNRRGLSSPHVAGVEWGYGAMGCATWRGPRLKDLLGKAGVKAGAVEVWLDGADGPVLPTTPDFHKSLPIDKAMSDDVIIAIDDERPVIAAPQWLSSTHHRARLDCNLLDEAPHQHSAQRQAARQLLDAEGISRADGDVSGGSSVPQSG